MHEPVLPINHTHVFEVPQDLHLHLCTPAPIFPFLFIAAPQAGHLYAFIPISLEIRILTV